jgi:alginate O-acetyltransferase complex protein AlgI
LAYTLQIYFDFCGYSNMAIGLAFQLGFTFPKNFDYPYVAQSITEFWRRWKTVRNLLIVFFLTGLWHGAAWQFIVWGLYHGVFLMLERFGLGRALERAPRPLRHVYALAVVMVGWVFFRAESLAHGMRYLFALVTPPVAAPKDVVLSMLLNAQTVAGLLIGSVLAFPVIPWIFERLRTPRAEPISPETPSRLATQRERARTRRVSEYGAVLARAVAAGACRPIRVGAAHGQALPLDLRRKASRRIA